MIWLLLAFAAFVWWLGVRIGTALDGVEGSHVLEDKRGPACGVSTHPSPRAQHGARGGSIQHGQHRQRT